MTLGEKIRKYRLLKGMTQRELGEAVGFKKSTADVRINQYESNKMAPKADIRKAIADALEVDVAALSDVNISSFEDIMHVLFEFEDKLGMKVEKKDGTTSLVFNDSDKNIASLISYINLWQNQRIAMGMDGADVSDEAARDYRLWEGRFKSNIEAYYQDKKDEIDRFYKKDVAAFAKTAKYAKKTSEITLLLKDIIDAGISISTGKKAFGAGDMAPGFTFTVNELLVPPSDAARKSLARFLAEYRHFKDLGATCFTDLQMTGKALTITYYVRASSFGVITSQVNDYLDYKSKESIQGDFFRDSFEQSFQADLESHYNMIEDEIKTYAARIKADEGGAQ